MGLIFRTIEQLTLKLNRLKVRHTGLRFLEASSQGGKCPNPLSHPETTAPHQHGSKGMTPFVRIFEQNTRYTFSL